MNGLLSTLISLLGEESLADANVIPWSCPVPAFGDPSRATVASLGLNPSNREFVDGSGRELDGANRRFHTLSSLRLPRWSDATARHLKLIMHSCSAYFTINPYNRWFGRLDYLLSGIGASYYGTSEMACHLDLIPFATTCKWTDLTSRQRSSLFALTGDSLGILIRDSPIRVVVLNGVSVVEQFQTLAGLRLEKKAMSDWSLPRRSRRAVLGYSYRGVVRQLAGVDLKREILTLGFNHNLQSSFGVTIQVASAIRQWVAQASSKVV
jgi:hypothetical protein